MVAVRHWVFIVGELHSTPLCERSSEYFNFSDSCNDACPTKFVPACGTDKITYANECLLKMVACRDDNWLLRRGCQY